MNDELEMEMAGHPLYETASLYEIDNSDEGTTDLDDYENLYALPA